MGERVAIVGSRGFEHLDEVVHYVETLAPDAVVISGGAAGVDRLAVATAQGLGLACEQYLPAWNAGRGAGPIRNAKIVERADRVVAFWDGRSRGTADCVRQARAAGKPVELHRGAGVVEVVV